MPVERGFQRLISRNPRVMRVFSVVREYAGSGRPLLLVGEGGTGRNLLARALAEELGTPADLIVRDAKGLAFEQLIGSGQNSITYIDNVADLPRTTQEKLLQALRDDTATSLPRLVLAALPDLPGRVNSGECLPELYYRLAACEVYLPPLREREGDLPILIDHFVRQVTDSLQRPRPRVLVGFLDTLGEYPFPGNVAELEMIVHKSIFWADEDRLSEDTARITLANHTIGAIAEQLVNNGDASLTRILFPTRLPTVTSAKKQLIQEALRRTEGNQSQAAKILGLTPPAINKFLIRLESTGD